jgi:hypothetical protein
MLAAQLDDSLSTGAFFGGGSFFGISLGGGFFFGVSLGGSFFGGRLDDMIHPRSSIHDLIFRVRPFAQI